MYFSDHFMSNLLLFPRWIIKRYKQYQLCFVLSLAITLLYYHKWIWTERHSSFVKIFWRNLRANVTNYFGVDNAHFATVTRKLSLDANQIWRQHNVKISNIIIRKATVVRYVKNVVIPRDSLGCFARCYSKVVHRWLNTERCLRKYEK